MSHPDIGGAHLCKRWNPNVKDCLFRHLSWHGAPHVEEGDSWDDPDTENPPRNVNSPAYTPLGKAIYESLLLDWAGPKMQPAFEPAWNPQWTQPFNDMSGLVEIGIVQQIAQRAGTQGPTLQPKVIRGPSLGREVINMVPEALAYAIATAAAVAVVSIVARGAKGGAFRTAVKYGWDVKASPMWSVTNQATEQYMNGYVARGAEVIQERRPVSGVAGDFGQGSAAAHGITGYI